MANKPYKDCAVIITRAQPFHNGHFEVIKEMIRTHKKVLVLIGSANKSHTLRNPFDINIRNVMVDSAIEEYQRKNKNECDVIVAPLNDWSMENYTPAVKEWGKYLYYSIVYLTGTKSFDLYYNDDISIVRNWFTESLLERIEFRTINRNDVMNGVSSTKIREALLNDDNDYLRKSLPSTIDIENLKVQYKKVVENPEDDFIMK